MVAAKTEKKYHCLRALVVIVILSLHVLPSASPFYKYISLPFLPYIASFLYVVAMFMLSMALAGTPRNLPSTAPMQASVTRAWATICLVALTTSTWREGGRDRWEKMVMVEKTNATSI